MIFQDYTSALMQTVCNVSENIIKEYLDFNKLPINDWSKHGSRSEYFLNDSFGTRKIVFLYKENPFAELFFNYSEIKTKLLYK